MNLLRMLWRTLQPAKPIARVPLGPRSAQPRPTDASSEKPSIDVATRHISEAEQPWRTGDRAVSEFRVGNEILFTTSMEISPGPGFLGLSGESHYKEAWRAAQLSRTRVHEPVFTATLVPEPSNIHDCNAVAVLIDPFGKIGYIPRNIAPRLRGMISAAKGAVRCPAQIRGGSPEKPMLGVVLDTTRATGARLSMYAADNAEQVDKFWAMRRASDAVIVAAKVLESSDPDRAIHQYKQALDQVTARRQFALEHDVFPGEATDSPDADHTLIIDRLTLCCIKRGRTIEAVEEANRFFATFPAAKKLHAGQAILKRVEKAALRDLGR
jgi:hypothetical protein